MSRLKPSGWKGGSITRANTTSSIRGRISAPIPITVDDDEFPIRTPGTGITTTLGPEDMGPQSLQASVQHEEPLFLEAHPEQMEEPSRTAPQALSSPTPPTPHSIVQQTAHSTALEKATASNPYKSSTDKPQRKKSTLRSVFGRLFGKKMKSNGSTISNGTAVGTGRAGQHHSVPTALRNPPSRAISQPRSTSMPITEYNRALNSHSPFAAGDKETGGPAQDDVMTQPKQASTPSGTPGFTDWTGLAPRPASSHARTSRLFLDDGQTPIGYAVTSGSHPKRRSRSVGQLRNAAATQINFRRRSDEIRYWRESYDPDPLSPISSHKHDLEGQPSSEKGTLQEEKNLEPPRPFNFGPMGEMAGMKITQAASLETRVSRLEERLEGMESIIVRLQNRTSRSLLLQGPSQSQSVHGIYTRQSRGGSSGFSIPELASSRSCKQTRNSQADAPSRVQTHGDSRPSTDSTQQSNCQTLEGLSSRPSFSSSPAQIALSGSHLNSLSVELTDSTGRPLSTSTTIRGMPSSSPIRSVPFVTGGSLTAHHYTALLNLIQAEQSARAALEAQVSMLQHQLESLLQNSSIGIAAAYPRSSPDDLTNLPPISVARSEYSSFEHESDGESEEEENYDNEVYRTPIEDQSHFAQEEYKRGIELTGGHGQPRTLSLSQLTLRTGVPVSY